MDIPSPSVPSSQNGLQGHGAAVSHRAEGMSPVREQGHLGVSGIALWHNANEGRAILI